MGLRIRLAKNQVFEYIVDGVERETAAKKKYRGFPTSSKNGSANARSISPRVSLYRKLS